MEKKRVFSGVQPSGNLTIANYLGAIKNFSKLQNKYDCFFSIVDMHSITVPQNPKDLRRRTLEVMSVYIATGIDYKQSTIFIQSHVPEHAQLCWVLNSISYMGQLSRMTQFKDKSKKSEENLNSALFTYPVLMAADILLYMTDLVPVGEDQKQHLELARDLAERFNSKYSDTFKIPSGFIKTDGGRIMSLKNPDIKMSKSDKDENAYIMILDDKDSVIRKIKKSVTDSDGNFRYDDSQKGLKNLINIYSGFSDESIEEIVKRYENESYLKFKEDLGELIWMNLSQIQDKYYEIVSNKDELEKIYKDGAERAESVAFKTLRKVYKKIGFIPR